MLLHCSQPLELHAYTCHATRRPKVLRNLTRSVQTTTSQRLDDMELGTDSVVCFRPVGFPLDSTVHPHPTANDWQRWKPSIKARYRRLPARVIIQEMKAERLLVT
jgi:hypothetical protein